ncbi:MAG: serine/threonine-protein kinase [Myxococcota bacterium]
MKLGTDEFTGRRFGKYEVLCRLAVGGMAEIFLAFPRSGPFTGRAVVLKRILAEQREDPAALQMLIDEAKLTATLSHPNVAQVLDLEVAADEVLLVIEYIAGANLEEVVDAYKQRGEAVPLGFALAAIREAAQGLGHAHTHKNARGEPVPIIHRDVTPRNVMLDFEGSIKMLDFGIARVKGSERRTQVGMVRGTTAYMSPEQAIGKELDPRTDLFSLGIIFHELLTGQRLFHRGNPAQEMAAVYEEEIPPPSKVNRRVPKALDAVVLHALDRRIEKRYQSATEFVRDLSLAAGSTTWTRERCAELARQQFAARQKDIDKLLARMPGREPEFPESRTVVGRGGPTPVLEDEVPARTVINQGPLVERSRGQPPSTDPFQEPVTDTRPVTPKPQQKLSADELFSDMEDAPEKTRIIQGSRRALAPVSGTQSVSEVPTDPRRAAVKRPGGGGSRLPLILAAVGALALGAVGGALLIKRLQPSASPVGALGRVSIKSDRPADVFFNGQLLGATPAAAFVPSGQHSLQLKEPDGTTRVLVLDVKPGEEANVVVTLDSLEKLP